ncbi:hypothetical protein P1X14_03195 [Sphingomonas sp. AOB5]|uniref:hypothetical protein n=1 Tax=Sphingomonas sp. AOB5 TaxID=3034017 RepID=UPI0023F73AAA|nr:hypothetical protein [Sphingomonas sp. AOB5]MDF7774244.1 hypothetical protein [Sphingomonas sp. AOB5]
MAWRGVFGRSWVARLILGALMLAAAPGARAQYYDGHSEVDIEEVRRSALLLYGYQPLSMGLNSAGTDWKRRIGSEDARSLLSRETVDDTLLFLMSPTLPDAPRMTPDPAAAHRFCSAALAGQVSDTAELRRAAVCIARFPDLGARHGERIAAAFTGQSSAFVPRLDVGSSATAHDALLLYRALRFCGCGPETMRASLLAIVVRTEPVFAAGYTACPGWRCATEAESMALGSYTAVLRGAIFALIENPDLATDPGIQPLLRLAGTEQMRLSVQMTRRATARFMERPCSEVAFDYAECRRRYPYNNHLTAVALKMASGFILDTRPMARRCAVLLRQMREMEPELRLDPGLARAMDRFAAQRCPAKSRAP